MSLSVVLLELCVNQIFVSILCVCGKLKIGSRHTQVTDYVIEMVRERCDDQFLLSHTHTRARALTMQKSRCQVKCILHTHIWINIQYLFHKSSPSGCASGEVVEGERGMRYQLEYDYCLAFHFGALWRGRRKYIELDVLSAMLVCVCVCVVPNVIFMSEMINSYVRAHFTFISINHFVIKSSSFFSFICWFNCELMVAVTFRHFIRMWPQFDTAHLPPPPPFAKKFMRVLPVSVPCFTFRMWTKLCVRIYALCRAIEQQKNHITCTFMWLKPKIKCMLSIKGQNERIQQKKKKEKCVHLIIDVCLNRSYDLCVLFVATLRYDVFFIGDCSNHFVFYFFWQQPLTGSGI